MSSLEKWVDELQAAVDKLTKRVANAASSAFKPDITTPTDGQVIMYDSTAEKWKNGDVFTPEITEPAAGQVIMYDGTSSSWVNGSPAQPGFTPVIENLYDNHQATPQATQDVLALTHNLSDYDMIVFTTQVQIDNRSCIGSFVYSSEFLVAGKAVRLIAYEAYNVYMVLDITADNSITIGLLGNSELRLISVDGYQLTDHPEPVPPVTAKKRKTKKEV